MMQRNRQIRAAKPVFTNSLRGVTLKADIVNKIHSVRRVAG